MNAHDNTPIFGNERCALCAALISQERAYAVLGHIYKSMAKWRGIKFVLPARLALCARTNDQDIIHFSRQLGVLLKSGTALVDALNVLTSNQKNPRLKRVITEIREAIISGESLAGALERYGAATKSFEHAINISRRCKNFYLCGVFTPELLKRIDEARSIEKSFDIIKIVDDEKEREKFFKELFHHTLRII